MEIILFEYSIKTQFSEWHRAYVYLKRVCAHECVLSLEVTLQKRSEGPMWPELVMGDRRGEYVMNDEQAALIHERLTYLTSEDMVSSLSTLYW